MQNEAGAFIEPTLESVTAAAKNALGTIPDDLRYSLTNAPGKESYPICGTVWAVTYTNPPGGLDHYYRTNVIGGPGAFVMVAKNFESFGDAIISKLIAEVAQMHEPQFRRTAAR